MIFHYILSVIYSFDPNSKVDAFLLVTIFWLAWIVLVLVSFQAEPPSVPQETSPFG